MKVRSALALATVSTLMITGCGSSSSDEAKPPPTSTEVTTSLRPTTTMDIESLFVSMVRSDVPAWWIGSATDAELVSLGHTTCETFDAVGVYNTVWSFTSDPSYSDVEIDAMSSVMGFSIAAFCPEYKAEIDRLAEN